MTLLPFKLIGLMGRAQSGKDTVCQQLRARIDADSQGRRYAVRRAFADPLKAELARACGVTVREIEDHKAVFRLGLQWWGTEFRRQYCRSDRYWIRAMEQEIWRLSRLKHAPSVVILTDCRFPNEAEFVKAHGGTLLRVERPLPWLDRVRQWLSRDPACRHASERAMRHYPADAVILNRGTVEDLAAAVDRWWGTQA